MLAWRSSRWGRFWSSAATASAGTAMSWKTSWRSTGLAITGRMIPFPRWNCTTSGNVRCGCASFTFFAHVGVLEPQARKVEDHLRVVYRRSVEREHESLSKYLAHRTLGRVVGSLEPADRVYVAELATAVTRTPGLSREARRQLIDYIADSHAVPVTAADAGSRAPGATRWLPEPPLSPSPPARHQLAAVSAQGIREARAWSFADEAAAALKKVVTETLEIGSESVAELAFGYFEHIGGVEGHVFADAAPSYVGEVGETYADDAAARGFPELSARLRARGAQARSAGSQGRSVRTSLRELQELRVMEAIDGTRNAEDAVDAARKAADLDAVEGARRQAQGAIDAAEFARSGELALGPEAAEIARAVGAARGVKVVDAASLGRRALDAARVADAAADAIRLAGGLRWLWRVLP